MSNHETESKLGKLVEIFAKCEKPESIEADDTLTLKVSKALTSDELNYLNQSPLSIARALSADGSSLKVSELSSAPTGSELSVRVPRDRRHLFIAENFDDFLQDGSALIHEPAEYIILEESLEGQPFQSSINSQEISERVRSYRTARSVVDLLKREADHTSSDDKTFSFFDAERIDIVIGASTQVLTSDFPVNELNEFLSEGGMNTLRKEAFKTTLWDTLKDYSTEERFRRLIEKGRGASFMRAVQYNFRLAKSDHTLGKRLECARQEYIELAGSLAKLASGLEAKAFVLPGTLLLAGRFIGKGDGATFSNTVISLSTVALAIISTIAYRAHRDIARDFEEEIEKARNNLSDTHEDELIRGKLNRLSGRFKRIQKLKLSIAIGSWLVAIGIIIACLWPATSTGEGKNKEANPDAVSSVFVPDGDKSLPATDSDKANGIGTGEDPNLGSQKAPAETTKGTKDQIHKVQSEETKPAEE